MNWKHTGWWFALPIVAAIVLPFVGAEQSRALHEGLTLAVATCGLLTLGLVLTEAVARGIAREDLEYRLAVAVGSLVVAGGYGFAPKALGGFIIALGCLIALVGGLRYTRRKVRERGGAQNAAT